MLVVIVIQGMPAIVFEVPLINQNIGRFLCIRDTTLQGLNFRTPLLHKMSSQFILGSSQELKLASHYKKQVYSLYVEKILSTTMTQFYLEYNY